MGPVLRRWTLPAPSPVCCSFSCIAQGSRGLSLRGRGSRICRQSRRCCCGWFSQDLWVLHIRFCITPETMSAFDVVKDIKQYQEKWLQHVQRMDTNRLPKQALQYKPKRKKKHRTTEEEMEGPTSS